MKLLQFSKKNLRDGSCKKQCENLPYRMVHFLVCIFHTSLSDQKFSGQIAKCVKNVMLSASHALLGKQLEFINGACDFLSNRLDFGVEIFKKFIQNILTYHNATLRNPY